MKPIPIEQRFWKFVNKTSSCWFWDGAKAGNGYGVTSKHIDNVKTQVYAHRISYEFANGPIPKTKFVLHKCDKPNCVNPKHLRVGTQKENMRDCSLKKRIAKGKDLPQTKLTEKNVRQIRSIYSKGKISMKKIGIMFSINPANVFYIVHKITWAHVN